MKIKRLCDLSKKDIERQLRKVAALLRSPTHLCRDCCRTANSKKHLCKPVALPDLDAEEEPPA